MRERGSAGGRTSQLTTIRPPGSWIPPGGPVASHVQLFAWGEALLMFVGELQVPLQYVMLFGLVGRASRQIEEVSLFYVLSVERIRIGMRLSRHATRTTVPGWVWRTTGAGLPMVTHLSGVLSL